MIKSKTGEEILQMQLPYQNYIVDQIMPPGLFLLAGKPKIGKSWFVLQLGIAVSNGQDFLGHSTNSSDVLYLCLEDTYQRIQNRLIDYEDENLDNIEFVVEAKTLSDGLMKDLGKYIHDKPSVKFIIIDTLQRVRDATAYGNTYGQDYSEINEFNHFVNKTGISILLVHHLRKMKADDPFEEISGTTGIAGAVDGMYVLNSDRSINSSVSLLATGRDIERFEMKLKFNTETHHWEVLEKTLEDTVESKTVLALIKLMYEIDKFEGTATKLSEFLKNKFDIVVQPSVLSKKISKHVNLLIEHDIEFYRRRNGRERTIILVRKSGTGVGNDGNDVKLA